MIEIRNLTVAFGGVRGLNDLSADIGAKITGLVGPNGAGKTTLLNAMSGFVKCASGTVIVDGVDLLRIAMNWRAAFGLRRTFQTEQVVENLTVWNNVAAALDNLPTGGRPRRDLIAEALDYVGLSRQAERIGAALNASERRLVEIARCIVAKPRLVMMDEPGAGLSQSESDHLGDVIIGIPEFCGAQVLLVFEENLRVAGTALNRRELDEAVDRAFDTFPELKPRLGTRAGALSGGQQQMLVLGQAIVSQPRYILADELSFGLAPVIVARLVPVLEAFAAKGIGVLLIEQFTHIALRIAHHAYVMERGRICFSGAPEALLKNPDILHSAYLAG